MKKVNWQKSKLGDLCIFRTGKLDSNAAKPDGKYPFFTCSQQTFRTNTFSFDMEAVILGGNNANGVYPLKYFIGKFNVYQRTYVISSKNEKILNNRFLYYVLRPKMEYFRSVSTGVTTKFLTMPILQSLEIELPTINEQKKIATLIGNYDDLIENSIKKIKILEQMAEFIYDEWFVKFKFPGHENVKMTDSDFGKIPEGWEVKRISDFGKVVTGKTPSTKDAENYGEFMCFVKTPDMHNNLFSIDSEQKLSKKGVSTQKNKILPPNSIMVSCIGTIGVVSINASNCQTNQQINSIILNNKIYLEYLYFFCKGLKAHLENLGSTGATMGNVNKEKFQSIKLICPSEEIIKNYSNISSPIFHQIKVLQLKNQNLSATRDLLLPRLISGEIDVSDLDIKVPEVEA